MSLPQDIAAMAESIVNTLAQTDYQHVNNIDPQAGVYDCDCNGFAAFVLRAVALQKFVAIPIDTQPNSVESRPRASQYYNFFALLPPESLSGWSRVDLLSDAGRGDILAWHSPTIEPHADSHMVILGETPTLDPSQEFHVVRVYGSAAEAHFDDTRTPGEQPSPTRTTGVGSGFLNFKGRWRGPSHRLSLRTARHCPTFLSSHRHRARPVDFGGDNARRVMGERVRETPP